MKKLAIFGAGGFGREMALMIEQINLQEPTWDLVGFFDDGKVINDEVDGYKVIGNLKDLNELEEPLNICVAIADPQIRNRIAVSIVNPRLRFPPLFHPQCMKGSSKNIFGEGCILTAGVILTTNIVLGRFNIINLASTIGHDVRLGDNCTVMPGCSVSGHVTIGSRVQLGTGSRVIQGIEIGDDCVIGAGAVVTKSFESNKRIMGVPARAI